LSSPLTLEALFVHAPVAFSILSFLALGIGIFRSMNSLHVTSSIGLLSALLLTIARGSKGLSPEVKIAWNTACWVLGISTSVLWVSYFLFRNPQPISRWVFTMNSVFALAAIIATSQVSQLSSAPKNEAPAAEPAPSIK